METTYLKEQQALKGGLVFFVQCFWLTLGLAFSQFLPCVFDVQRPAVESGDGEDDLESQVALSPSSAT